MAGEEILHSIDKNNDNAIAAQELKDFLDGKDKSFLPDEKNLQAVAKEMDINFRGQKKEYRIDQDVLYKIHDDLTKKINDNKELTASEVKLFKLWLYIVEDKKNISFVSQKDYMKDIGGEVRQINIRYNITPIIEQQKPAKESIVYAKNIEKTFETMSLDEKTMQLQTIAKAAEIYDHYLLSKGIGTPQYDGYMSQNKVYIKEISEKIKDPSWINALTQDKIKFYMDQLFPTQLAGLPRGEQVQRSIEALQSYLLNPNGWDKKNEREKMIEVLRYLRAIDTQDGFLTSYDSGELVLSMIEGEVSESRITHTVPKGVELNTSLQSLDRILKFDTIFQEYQEAIAGCYSMSQVTRGGEMSIDNMDALIKFFEKYGLPRRGSDSATQSFRAELAKKLVEERDTLKGKEQKEKWNMKKNIMDEMLKNTKAYRDIQKKYQESIPYATGEEKIRLETLLQSCTSYIDAIEKFVVHGESLQFDGMSTAITLDDMVDIQYKNYEMIMMNQTLEKIGGYYILQSYSEATDGLFAIKSKGGSLTADEKIISMIADIKGVGGYRSDKTVNTIRQVTIEMIIQIVLMAISGGIANIAAKGVISIVEKSARAVKAVNYAERVVRYANMASKSGFFAAIKVAPELEFLAVLTEGLVFHATNTVLTEAVVIRQFDDRFREALNPFSGKESLMGYAESVAFMGIMKTFGQLTNKIIQSFVGQNLNKLQTSEIFRKKMAAQTITLPGEVLSMQATSVAVSLLFGHDLQLSPEEWINTIAMVIGLRVAHMGTGSLNKIAKDIESNTKMSGVNNIENMQATLDIKGVQKDAAGKIIAVEYEIRDGKNKVIEQGTATEKEIELVINKKKEMVEKEKNTGSETKENKEDKMNGGKDVETVDMTRYKEGVDMVFEQNSELAKIGTKEEYMQYLMTIFPESKVKDIVYHRTSSNFDSFDKTKIKEQTKRFYFSTIMNSPRYGVNRMAVILNIKNLAIPSNNSFIEQVIKEYPGSTKGKSQWFHLPSHIYQNAKDYKYDGVKEYENTSDEEYSVYEPEQIHILGSKQDIEGFKIFVDSKNKNNESIKENQSSPPENINIVSPKQETANKAESSTSETKSTIDPEIVKANAILADGPRLQKAEELLPSRKQTLVDENGKPTVLGEKVLNAHNNSKGGEIYKITPEQLTEKVRILKDAGFTSDEIRILIENGICGKVEMEVMDVNKNGVFDGIDVEMMKENTGNEKILTDVQLLGKYGLNEEIAKYDKETHDKVCLLLRNEFSIDNEEIVALSKMDKYVVEKIVALGSDRFTYTLDGLTNDDMLFLKNLDMDSIKKGRILYDEGLKSLPITAITKLQNIKRDIITEAKANNKLKDLLEVNMFSYYNIVDLAYVANCSKETITKIIKLQKTKIHTKISDLEKIENISDGTITKAIELRELGLWISISDFEKIENISDDTITKAIKLKKGKIYANISDLEKIENMSDDTITKAIKLKEMGIYIDVSSLEIIEKYSLDTNRLIQYKEAGMEVGIKDLIWISQIDTEINDIELVKEMKNIIQNWPDCDISGIINKQELLIKFNEYLDKKMNERNKKMENVLSKEIDPAKKIFIDKMFRLNDFAGGKQVEFVNSKGEIIQRNISGFTMEQETGNCYMIAAINAIRNNPRFAEWLYESVEYVKAENPLDTKWKMKLPITDPNGTRYEVSLRELFSEKKKGIDDIENYSPTNQDINGFVQFLQRKEQNRIRKNEGGDQIVSINFEELGEVTNIYITEEVKDQISDEIQQKNGKYYELFKEYIQEDMRFFSVSAPIGYQVLEGIISKATRGKGEVNKEIMVGGVSSEILELILGNEYTYMDIGSLNRTNLTVNDIVETDKLLFSHALQNISTGRYIITCSVKNQTTNDDMIYSPYFEYNNADLARGHAYSITGYDKVNNMLEVVNPWDNTKIIHIPYEKFFDVFDEVNIAEKK